MLHFHSLPHHLLLAHFQVHLPVAHHYHQVVPLAVHHFPAVQVAHHLVFLPVVVPSVQVQVPAVPVVLHLSVHPVVLLSQAQVVHLRVLRVLVHHLRARHLVQVPALPAFLPLQALVVSHQVAVASQVLVALLPAQVLLAHRVRAVSVVLLVLSHLRVHFQVVLPAVPLRLVRVLQALLRALLSALPVLQVVHLVVQVHPPVPLVHLHLLIAVQVLLSLHPAQVAQNL